MINQVITAMDSMIDEIYSPDQSKLQDTYLAVIDAIGGFLQWMMEQGYEVDLNEDLGKLQAAMRKKDYIVASDILEYDMKPDFVELKESMV